MRVAKAKGRLRGKQPKLNRRQEAHLVSLVHSGEYTISEVADLFGIHRLPRHRTATHRGMSRHQSTPGQQLTRDPIVPHGMRDRPSREPVRVRP